MLLDNQNQNQVPKSCLNCSSHHCFLLEEKQKPNLIDQKEIQCMGRTPGKLVKNALWPPTSWIAAFLPFPILPTAQHTHLQSRTYLLIFLLSHPVQGFLHSFTSVKVVKTLDSNKIVLAQIRTWDINYSICI